MPAALSLLLCRIIHPLRCVLVEVQWPLRRELSPLNVAVAVVAATWCTGCGCWWRLRSSSSSSSSPRSSCAAARTYLQVQGEYRMSDVSADRKIVCKNLQTTLLLNLDKDGKCLSILHCLPVLWDSLVKLQPRCVSWLCHCGLLQLRSLSDKIYYPTPQGRHRKLSVSSCTDGAAASASRCNDGAAASNSQIAFVRLIH